MVTIRSVDASLLDKLTQKGGIIFRLEDERHNIQPADNDNRKGYLKALELALYFVKDIKE